MGALDAFDPVATTAAHVRRARQAQRLLAKRSLRGRKTPDLLVAAAAEDLDVPSSTTTPTSTSSPRSPGNPASGSCQQEPSSNAGTSRKPIGHRRGLLICDVSASG